MCSSARNDWLIAVRHSNLGDTLLEKKKPALSLYRSCVLTVKLPRNITLRTAILQHTCGPLSPDVILSG